MTDGVDNIWMASVADSDGFAAIATRLRAAWATILDAEHARGVDASAESQAYYEAALVLFRFAQIEAWTATLGAIPLLQEQIDALSRHARRCAACGRRIERIERRQDIADLVTFGDRLSPF
jgi:hypothetical protein